MLEKMKKDWGKKLGLLILVLIIPQTYKLLQDVILVGISVITKWLNFDFIAFAEDRLLMIDAIFCVIWLSVYGVWYYFIVSRKKEQIKENPKEPIGIALVLQAFVIVFGFGGMTTLWMDFIKNNLAESNLFGLYTSYQNYTNSVSLGNESYIWAFLSLVLLGPIVEELLFRGVQYHYAEKICGKWFPVIITGVSFGVWHGELMQVVYAIFLGIMLGIIYYYTRNLWFLMFIHVANNFFAALPPGLNTEQTQTVISLLGKIAIIPMLIILGVMVRKILKREREVMTNSSMN